MAEFFGFEINRKNKEPVRPSFVPRVDTDDGAGVIQAGGHFGAYIDLDGDKAKTDVDNEDEDLYDERLTGRYIITRLRHTFDFGNPKKHTIQATVIKDSVTKPYSNNLPPNPKRLI